MSKRTDMVEKISISADAIKLHRKLTVVDCHCDTILQVAKGKAKLGQYNETGHIDIYKLQDGGIRVQFFALFIEGFFKPYRALSRTLQLIDTFNTEIDSCGYILSPGLNMKQIKSDLKQGKIIAVMGIEGGEALNGDISALRIFYKLGVRFLGLTWNQRNEIADGVGEKITGGGLTCFGRNLVQEMNRLGMIIDLAHISEAGFWDVLEISGSPVMVSHANCKSLCNHPRNLNDEQIKALAETGGILGLSFVPQFLSNDNPTINDLLDHIDHVARLAGTNLIALGSDFDGIEKITPGLNNSSCYPSITAGLLERGYTEKEIKGIMGENMIEFMKKVLH
ncbi:dipeptidase [Phosphitispora sp. TUW77]|uniref:dipeptidase n=1 Tax=Phosphitispora sp. TUW77 TaxID=3152361 RepID=UPI003AB45078